MSPLSLLALNTGINVPVLFVHHVIDKNASVGAKHSRLTGLLNSICIAGSDNPLVEVEYKGKQSNVILTTQGESTLKIFGE